MGVNAANVFIGAPDQTTTGAILSGPVLTDPEAPDTIDDVDLSGLTDSGYVNEDGVTITPEDTTESIKDWSGAEIRRILTEFTGTIAWTHLELSAGAARNYFGDANVQVTPATSSKGTLMRASLGKNELDVKRWVFKIKDGNKRLLVVVPRGQVASRGEIPLTATGAITLPVELATYPDENGQNIYIYTDDGVFSAGAAKGNAQPGSTYPSEATVTASDSTNAAKLTGLGFVANPLTAWTTGQKITVGAFDFNWSGTAWAAGAHA
ncbi:major tail protein [Microbacterium phage IndyLu]|uniref:major tail protein n=1 Tax=Microbacterium phage IndyLu TaxID=2885152 RepID=UPI001E75AD1D|nr:major tail protein [Microbacterium phage IndyLu]UDG78714.1 major tail protein [Microbacterium phage IndyLu]